MTPAHGTLDTRDWLLYRSRRQKSFESAGEYGTFLQKKGHNSWCFRKHCRFSHQVCPPQNEVWAQRKPGRPGHRIRTRSSPVFSSKPWRTMRTMPDWTALCSAILLRGAGSPSGGGSGSRTNNSRLFCLQSLLCEEDKSCLEIPSRILPRSLWPEQDHVHPEPSHGGGREVSEDLHWAQNAMISSREEETTP